MSLTMELFMNISKYFFITFSFLFLNSMAHATGVLTVKEEITLKAGAEKVWSTIGSFGGLHTWHPAATKTDLKGSGIDAGDTRILTLGDGATITEVLVDHDSGKMTYTYVITASPLPVKGYRSELKVIAEGKGQSRVIWSSNFDSNGAEDTKAIEVITGVYKGGLSALTESLGK